MSTADDMINAFGGGEDGFTTGRENSHRRPKGYADWNPQSKTRELLAQVEKVLDEYEDQLPLTVRQIFYRLVGAYGYDKTEKAYKRLGEHLVRARRAKLLDFDAIRDDGVVTIRFEHYGGIEDFHNETGRRAKAYPRDCQLGQNVYIELWCEAAGMLSQLDRVADWYSVRVYSTGGFNSLTANYEIARRALPRNVPTVLLHVGDYDPSGESIFDSIAEDARAFVRADRTIMIPDILPVRVALTAAQVEEYELPTVPPKESDSRSAAWDGGTCHLEALAPDVLALVVEKAIREQLDLGVLTERKEQERADRAELLALPPGEEEAAE
jgi:hypothetical protein